MHLYFRHAAEVLLAARRNKTIQVTLNLTFRKLPHKYDELQSIAFKSSITPHIRGTSTAVDPWTITARVRRAFVVNPQTVEFLDASFDGVDEEIKQVEVRFLRPMENVTVSCVEQWLRPSITGRPDGSYAVSIKLVKPAPVGTYHVDVAISGTPSAGGYPITDLIHVTGTITEDVVAEPAEIQLGAIPLGETRSMAGLKLKERRQLHDSGFWVGVRRHRNC